MGDVTVQLGMKIGKTNMNKIAILQMDIELADLEQIDTETVTARAYNAAVMRYWLNKTNEGTQVCSK